MHLVHVIRRKLLVLAVIHFRPRVHIPAHDAFCVFAIAVLDFVGSMPRLRNERVGQVRFSVDGNFVGVLSAGKGMEVLRIRSHEEALKKIARRKRRQKEKHKGVCYRGLILLSFPN
jgi:hypothetical protein